MRLLGLENGVWEYFCCGHVFRREREVKLVLHEKGDWQSMCGGTDHSGPDGKFVLVGVFKF